MLLLALFSCDAVPRTTVPPDLGELTLLAIQDFGTEAEAEHVAGIAEWLRENIDSAPEGYYFDHLDAEDVEMIEHSDEDVDWERVLGAGCPARVNFSVDAYAAVVPEADQSFAEPNTYLQWDREITSGTEAEFVAGGPLGTWNEIEKSGPFGITIPYGMHKPYAWFDDGVLAAQSVVPEPGYDESGDNGIVVGFTIEVWVPDGDTTIWYNGSWSQLRTAVDDIAEADAFLDALIDGTREYFWGTETYVTGQEWEH